MSTEQRWPYLRCLLAAASFLALMWMSAFVASLIGWSFKPHGWRNVIDGLDLLVVSLLFGMAAIASARAILGAKPLSPWLLLAALVPLLISLKEVGVL